MKKVKYQLTESQLKTLVENTVTRIIAEETEVNEGLGDFIGGAAKKFGQKVGSAASKVGQSARDVYQGGKEASERGERARELRGQRQERDANIMNLKKEYIQNRRAKQNAQRQYKNFLDTEKQIEQQLRSQGIDPLRVINDRSFQFDTDTERK